MLYILWIQEGGRRQDYSYPEKLVSRSLVWTHSKHFAVFRRFGMFSISCRCSFSGLAVYGFIGLFLGPILLLAILLTVIDIYEGEYQMKRLSILINWSSCMKDSA